MKDGELSIVEWNHHPLKALTHADNVVLPDVRKAKLLTVRYIAQTFLFEGAETTFPTPAIYFIVRLRPLRSIQKLRWYAIEPVMARTFRGGVLLLGYTAVFVTLESYRMVGTHAVFDSSDNENFQQSCTVDIPRSTMLVVLL